MKSRYLIFSIAITLCLSCIQSISRGQQGQTPPPPGQYDWAPDCSHEGLPLPGPTVNLHRYTPDNTGTPVLPAAPVLAYRGSLAPNNLWDQGMDEAPDGNNVMAVSTDMPGEVSESASGAGQYVANYSQITLRYLNPVTNSVQWQVVVNDGTAACTLPKIVPTSLGYFYITWKEHNTSGDRIIAAIYDNGGLSYGRAAVSGTKYYTNLVEYSVSPDNAGGVSIAALDLVAGNHRVESQLMDQFVSPQWNTPNNMLQLNGPTGGGPASTKFNPVINYNSIMGFYEVFWGDNFNGPPSGLLVAQRVSAAGVVGLAAGGQPDFATTMPNPSVEFPPTW